MDGMDEMDKWIKEGEGLVWILATDWYGGIDLMTGWLREHCACWYVVCTEYGNESIFNRDWGYS